MSRPKWYDSNFNEIPRYKPIPKILFSRDEFDVWARDDPDYMEFRKSNNADGGNSDTLNKYKIRDFVKRMIYKKIEDEKIEMKNGDIIDFDFMDYRGYGQIFWVNGELYSSEEPDSNPRDYQYFYTPKQVLTFTFVQPGYDASYHDYLWLDYDSFRSQFIPENLLEKDEKLFLKLKYEDKIYYLRICDEYDFREWKEDHKSFEGYMKTILDGGSPIFLVKKDGNIF
jgi:hypothetical protein